MKIRPIPPWFLNAQVGHAIQYTTMEAWAPTAMVAKESAVQDVRRAARRRQRFIGRLIAPGESDSDHHRSGRDHCYATFAVYRSATDATPRAA
jgi:hypothetical protein